MKMPSNPTNALAYHLLKLLLPLALWAALFLALPLSAATRSVVLAPSRVLLEGRTRSAVVRLINPNPETSAFKIELVTVRMDDFGIRTETKSPNDRELLARKLIRFSPRRATLPPQGMQAIRLMVRKPGDLPEGEYRAHLKVTPIADAPEQAGEEKGRDPGKVSLNINLFVSIAIPVIVRHGEGSVNVIPRAAVPMRSGADEAPFLETLLEREGPHSAYADVVAHHTPEGGSAPRYKLAEIKGVSFYSPNRTQTLRVPLLEKFNALPSGGTIDIEILNRETKPPARLGHGVFPLTGNPGNGT